MINGKKILGNTVKNKLLVITIPILVLFQNHANKSDTGYIKLQYFGEVSKPYPIITFYLPESIDTSYENFYIYKIPVTNSEFDSIQNAVEHNAFDSTTSTLPDLFEFTIVKNNIKKSFRTRDKESVGKIFNKIIIPFNHSQKEGLVRVPLNNFLERLGMPNMAGKSNGNRSRRRSAYK